ncbi:mechanosensitive ion channel family protein [Telluribacter sp. SYSU D00476]|uniref:mechanosensitive ion channel family protein n=1 Tax=Telluribacter sp. SYSU D00476 TaxID=2811430 RepID=UPI001FF2FA84|nr:mechanosensitive ion channel family protein [Telluribacter sp. SYSU D00476]
METAANELWQVLQNYYHSFIRLLPRLGLAIFVFLITLFIASQLRRWLRMRILQQTKDSLLTGFLAQLGYWIILLFGSVMALGFIGLDDVVTKILAGAGLSAFILGFALKDIGENFLAGILLAFKRPFRIGDRVETNGINGRVIGLNLRETIIKTLDGKDVYMPNGLILKTPLINYTMDGYLRLEFTIGLDYEDDLAKAIDIILTAVSSVKGVINEPPRIPEVSISELTNSSVNMKVYCWINSYDPDVSAQTVRTTAIRNAIEALAKAGYYLPADIIEIKNYQGREIATGDPNKQASS